MEYKGYKPVRIKGSGTRARGKEELDQTCLLDHCDCAGIREQGSEEQKIGPETGGRGTLQALGPFQNASRLDHDEQ